MRNKLLHFWFLVVALFVTQQGFAQADVPKTLSLGGYDAPDQAESWDGMNLQNAPVLFTYTYSGSQTLYQPEQLAEMKDMDITSISFKFFVEECYTYGYTSTMKLYLHEVDHNEFLKNESGKCMWEEFDAANALATTEFNAEFTDLAYGDDQEITFDLSAKPYHYTGKTLVVTVANEGNQYVEGGVRFYWVPSAATDSWRTLVFGSESEDFAANQNADKVLNGNEDKWKNAPAISFGYQSSSNPQPNPDPEPQPAEGKLTLGHFADQDQSAAWDGFNLQNAPALYTYNHSGSQVIYMSEELAGMKNQWLTSMTFKCFAQDCYPAEPYSSTMKLYVQEVDAPEFGYDAATEYYQWYAFDETKPQATLEFSADFMDACVNGNDVEVKFDLSQNPFYYTGKTLLVTVINDTPSCISDGGIRFYWIDSQKGDPWRSLIFGSDTKDFLTNQQQDLAVKTIDNEDKWKNAPAVEFTYKAGEAPEPGPNPDPDPDPNPNPEPGTDPDPLPDPNATSETLILGHFEDQDHAAAWDGFNLQNAPVIFTYAHSGSQVLYTPDELEAMKGQHITSLSFKCFAEDYYNSNPYSSHIKLYLQEYEGTEFPYNAEGEFYEWLPFDESKVIATADFTADFMDASINMTDIEVTFDFGKTPYYYKGQTLLVTVVNDAPECLDSGEGPVRFYWTDSRKGYPWRSLVYASDTQDFYANQKVDLAVKTTDNEDKWMNAPAVRFTYLKSNAPTPEPTDFSGGEGTEASPYLISKTEDLKTLADWTDQNKTQGVYFQLTQDLTGTPFNQVIGQSTSFKGIFDGQNHCISVDLKFADLDHVALFGQAEGATLKNLQVKGYVEGKNFVGGLAAQISEGTVIENVVNFCDVTGGLIVGGVVGQIFSSSVGCSVTQCANYGHVSAQLFLVGGVIGDSGMNTGNTIARIANYGHVDGTDTAGGLIGSTTGGDHVAYGINAGTVGNNAVFGSISARNDADITSIYFDAQYIVNEKGDIDHMKQTAELIGNSLQSTEQGSGFADTYWLYADNMYPRLKVCGIENSPIAVLYASPVMLAEGNTLQNIDSDFTVSTANGVQWTAKNGKVTVLGSEAKHAGEGAETLVASYEGLSREIDIVLVAKKPLAFSGGEGTSEAPFLISSLEDMKTLDMWCTQNKTDGVYFQLTTDLTETPVTQMIGSTIDFFGHFDGQGHTVLVDISNPLGYYTGLFGCIQNGSLRNIIVKGNVNGAYYVGGAVGQASQGSVIENVINCAEVKGQMYVGGVVGQVITQLPFSGAIVRQCANYGNVVGSNYVGGLIGDTGQQVGNLFERLANYGHVNGESGAKARKANGGIFGNVRPEDHVHYLLNAGTTETDDIAGCIGNTKSEDLIDLYYDAQSFSNPKVSFGNAMMTEDMLGENLMAAEAENGFSSQYWLFAQNMYPRLKVNGWEESPMAILYATPVLLNAESTLNNIQGSFKVVTETGVVWSSKNGLVGFNGNEATTLASGDDILVAEYQGVSREIPVTVSVPTGLNKVTEGAGHQVSGANGMIRLELAESAFVQIYDAAGKLIANGQYTAGQHDMTAHNGVYIVRIGHETFKVSVR